MRSSNRTRHDYRVGWICPLEVEQVAAIAMLDDNHDRLPQPPGDTNIYSLGSINGHNVVIAGLPSPGNCPAATVATHMVRTFPGLKHILLVGIGGGVPTEIDGVPVRLGHVVVSKPNETHSGAIQYDHGKAQVGHFERTGAIAPPPSALLNAAKEVSVRRQGMSYDPIWKNTQRIQISRPRPLHFRYPGIERDHLYRSDYTHQQPKVSCEVAKCDPSQLVPRVDNEEDSFVVVHRGTIASGESVLRDAKLRDNLAAELGALCFEMEAAGVLSDFPCLVIRGISDYCDSHKDDAWHGYAAAVAAAYARQLVFYMAIEETERDMEPIMADYELPFNISEVFEAAHFVARGDELERMHKTLTGGAQRRTVFIQGLGGIGKTQLAIAYVRRHLQEYSAVLWLNAKDESTLKQSYSSAAQWIKRYHPAVTYVSADSESKPDEDVKAVRQWLDETMNEDWLIVFDNYDHPALSFGSMNGAPDESGAKDRDAPSAFDLRKYLPQSDHGAIIITSRSPEVVRVTRGEILRLGKLENIDDCLQILAPGSDETVLKQDSAAIDLVKQLDGLPLALATASAYLEQVKPTCSEYLEWYQASWRQLHEQAPNLPAYDKTLYSTWNVSFNDIQRQNSTAAKLLKLWAYFDKEDLWYELLKDGKSTKAEWLQELTANSLTFHQVVGLLRSHGFVEPERPSAATLVESTGYSVHGCVHSWMKHTLNIEFSPELARVALECIAAHVTKPNLKDAWITRRRLTSHADRISSMTREIEIDGESAWTINYLGHLYSSQGKPRQAEAMHKRALRVYQQAFGPEDKLTLGTLNELGNLYVSQGKLDEAEVMLQQVLHGFDEALGRGHKLTLRIVNNLAIVFEKQGKLEQSEAMQIRALKDKEKTSEEEEDIKSELNTVNNLGLLHIKLGSLEQAEHELSRALKGRKKQLGPEHPLTLSTVYNFGLLYQKQNKLEQAEQSILQVLRCRETIFGQEHEATLNALNRLGDIYIDQGQYGKAEDVLGRALRGRENVLGQEHTSTLESVCSMAFLHKKRGMYEHATRMSERALRGYQNTLNEIPPDTPANTSALNLLEKIGDAYLELGRIDEARVHYQSALSGAKAVFGVGSQRYSRISAKVEFTSLSLWQHLQRVVQYIHSIVFFLHGMVSNDWAGTRKKPEKG